jgi:peptide deformylase
VSDRPTVPIVRYPHGLLRVVAEPCQRMDDYTVNMAIRLLEALAHLPGCLGLSAPQLGKARRMIAVDAGPAGEGTKQSRNRGPMVIVDPVVAASSGSEVRPERCVSVPGAVLQVPRATQLFVRGLVLFVKNERFEMMEFVEVRGLEARVMQHQLDHLEGTLVLDRALSRPERLRALGRHR